MCKYAQRDTGGTECFCPKFNVCGVCENDDYTLPCDCQNDVIVCNHCYAIGQRAEKEAVINKWVQEK